MPRRDPLPIFLDRDGAIIVERGYLSQAADGRILERGSAVAIGLAIG